MFRSIVCAPCLGVVRGKGMGEGGWSQTHTTMGIHSQRRTCAVHVHVMDAGSVSVSV